MRRYLYFAYGAACHGLFLVTYAYMAGFVGNLFVPKSIDSPASDPFWLAAGINTALVAAFAVPHSVMARPWFKRRLTRFVPETIERSTYVLTACLLMGLLMWQWRPMGLVIWDVQSQALRWGLQGLFAFGWLLVPAASLLINHFDLFGTRQVWLYLRNRPYTHLPFKSPVLYSRVRHPLYVGWMIAFWATPTMTAAHLVFAGLMTAYMLAAIPFEERDLVRFFGDTYAEYRRRVPALIPRFGRSSPAKTLSGMQKTTSVIINKERLT